MTAATAVTDPLPAHQAETAANRPRPKPLIPSGLKGWSLWPAAGDDPSRVFLVHQKPVMMLRIAMVRTVASPEDYVRNEAAAIAKIGRRPGPVEATGDTFASTKWTAKVSGKAKKGVIAARRSAAAPDDLIVISGYWPASAGRGLEEEIDLIILLTSAE